ncbi:MAG: deoxyribodipyrimidine photo-lyase [Sphaerochaeta sp.]|nr:deoxyribodipyrimidine photo-lyase [Sphaerochaeta sp.]
MIHPHRLKALNDKGPNTDGSYVVYWMQASQRILQNDALAYAIETANAMSKPLLVYFGITPSFPEANRRHFRFMLEGIEELYRELKAVGIPLLVHPYGIAKGLEPLYGQMAYLVVDRAYTRHERSWRRQVAQSAPCAMMMVETNVVVPLESFSNKEEYSAATLRRKITPMINEFVGKTTPVELLIPSLGIEVPYASADLSDIPALMEGLGIADGVSQCTWMHGGQGSAKETLDAFVAEHLDGYDTKRNDPANPFVSKLSPYLHFGMISPVTIYHEVMKSTLADVAPFLEELIVRRELAMNFVYFNPLYDSYEGLPEWARKSMAKHEGDERPYRYTLEQLEGGQTHDRYWNTAQKELVELGTIHGYMRMYWGKKILEWSPKPQEAFERALYLNNKYQMDGRDPNGFAGVAWCFGKHDRPWAERSIFGMVRYMNDKGLERKFKMEGYLQRIEEALQERGISSFTAEDTLFR